MDEDIWSGHTAQWRDPHQIATWWQDADATDPRLLKSRERGPFWDLLEELDLTLLVTREYEHLMMSLAPGRRVGFLHLPHPSGVAVDPGRGAVHVAATRNPNQLVELRPLDDEDGTLVPIRSRWLPGRLYMHDLALIGGRLHANAVGLNAVVSLDYDSGWERVWWPNAIEDDFSKNYLQLNSIAAGRSLEESFFSASADTRGLRRPGHKNFPVDGRGVIFSGATREVVGRGLTRPHSARLHDGRVWVDNSGYGQVCVMDDAGAFEVVATLPGWTRGLASAGGRLWVATSRVIPRFAQYAPGLDVSRSVCGIHAVDPSSGEIEASLIWPNGNQVFAVEAVSRTFSVGFPFRPKAQRAAVRTLFSTLKERS